MKRLMTRAPIALLIFAVACSSASPPREPEIRMVGDTHVVYRGHEITAELDFRWAEHNMGDEWLILGLSLSGGAGRSAEVNRDAITVRTPKGDIIHLPQPSEFRRVYGERRFDFERADAWSSPPATRYWDHLPCERWFFAPPAGGLAYETLYITPFDWCSGPIAFLVPGGFQPGEWILRIELEEERMRVPFVIGAS